MQVPKLDTHYLLTSELARELYEQVKDLPIVDHFTYLKARDLVGNPAFDQLDSLWLLQDPVKKRFLKEDQRGEEAFVIWADALSQMVLHPVYAWTQLEMLRWWGIDEFLEKGNAKEIYREIQGQLKQGKHRPSYFFQESKVKRIHFPLDPLEEIPPMDSYATTGIEIRPIFTPVQTLIVDDPQKFNAYLNRFSEVSGFQVEHYADLLNALAHSIDRFHQEGCRMAHHRLELMYAEDFTQEEVNFIFHKVRLGHGLLPIEKAKYRSALLHHLSEMYHSKSWVQQYYLGTIRQLKSHETGFDAMGDDETAWYLLRYLHALHEKGSLPKTILFHPHKAGLISSIASKFNSMTQEGWVQVRPSWESMTSYGQLEENLGQINHPAMLTNFVGMPSSSWVLPSLARHDYYKRSLCSFFAKEAKSGYLPEKASVLLPLMRQMIGEGGSRYFTE